MKAKSPKFLIFITIFIDLLGFGIVIPILTFIGDEYVVEGVGKAVLLATTMSVYSIAQMIFSPILGRISDRVGRRPVLLLSLCGSTLSYLVFALASQFPSNIVLGLSLNFWVILLSRLLGGICAANISTAQAYIADVTEAADRTKGMTLIGMAFGLGFAFGPVLGGIAAWVSHGVNPEFPAQLFPGLLAAGICGANAIGAYFHLPESLPPEKRGSTVSEKRFAAFGEVFSSLSHRTIGPLVLVFFFATFAFSNMEMALGLFLKKSESLRMTETGVYGIFIYIGLMLTIMHGYVVRKLVKIVPEAVLVVVGTVAQAIALAIVPTIPTLTGMLIAMTILAFGQGLCVPCLLSLVSQATDSERQGRVMGVTQSASAFARILGPLFAGAIVAGAGKFGYSGEQYGPAFYSGALVMLVAVWMAIVTRRRIVAREDFVAG